MAPLPVKLVLQRAPPEQLAQALRAAGLDPEWVVASNAADAVSRGLAKLVVCERVPGWQALMARVESAGGGCVLWGPPPSDDEGRGILPSALEAVQDENQLVRALVRTEARLWSSRNTASEEDGLVERVKTAERVSRFAQSIASQMELSGVAAEAVARTRDLCDASDAALFLVDSATGELCAPDSPRLKPGQGFAGKVAQTAQPLLLEEVQHPPANMETTAEGSSPVTGSLIAVPLLHGGDVLGVLQAFRRLPRPHFEKLHLQRLEALAPHLTIAVQNAQMNAQLRQSQAEVMQSNAELERKVKERTEQLARRKREWERTFDAISEPIAVQDGFTLKRTNLAYAKRANLPLHELHGKTCYKVLAGRESPCPKCPLLRGRGKELAGEVSFGKSIYEFSGFWLSTTDQEHEVVVHYRDVSEHRALQTRLRESERMAALGQLASGAAHEINNPIGFVASNLGTLKSWLEDLRESPSPDRQFQEILDDSTAIIEESLTGTRRVAEIVKALRELSRLELEQPVPASPNDSAARAVRKEFGESNTVQVSFLTEAQAQMPPLQLDQVLGHLLKNAHQALLGDQRVYVKTTADEQEVQIEIRDEGSGISPENLHRIFEPFFTTRGIGKGVGLGLTAAYGIVQRHGGAIDVSSVPGHGSTFTVRLPRAQDPRQVPP